MTALFHSAFVKLMKLRLVGLGLKRLSDSPKYSFLTKKNAGSRCGAKSWDIDCCKCTCNLARLPAELFGCTNSGGHITSNTATNHLSTSHATSDYNAHHSSPPNSAAHNQTTTNNPATNDVATDDVAADDVAADDNASTS